MHPLMCWDIVLNQFSRRSHPSNLTILTSMKKQYDWKIDLNSVLEKDFDALVLTDTKQRICWTSRGFEQMTGYTSVFAKNRRPSFLQGKRSSLAVRRKIREAIVRIRPIVASIINYRKDGTEYRCNIEILPLLTHQSKLIHFLAIEKAID
jgi:PAS domain S-box-containing protein